jgi:predicted XRE-type DNA-binding protein
MSDDLEIVRGSGKVFRDLDLPNPDLEQLRSLLAAQIIKILDCGSLTVRKAEELTGIAAADFSRIRNANLGRFTVDRLMTILGRLDQRVEVNIKVRPNVKRAVSVASSRQARRTVQALTLRSERSSLSKGEGVLDPHPAHPSGWAKARVSESGLQNDSIAIREGQALQQLLFCSR